MNRFLIIVGLFFLVSCKAQKINESILGVWVFDREVNELYLNDTSGFYGRTHPIIFDFKEHGDLIIKNYSYKDKDSIFSWFQKPDSIITIDSLDYTLHSLSQEGITLIDYNRADTYWLTFKRPKETLLDYNKTEIEKILLSNIWSPNDTLNRKLVTRFEYFDNNTMIYRHSMSDRNLNGIKDNLQLETWGIAKYKDYHFIYNYNDMALGTGAMEGINQITEINKNSYTITDSFGKDKKAGFHSIMEGVNNEEELKKIKGEWISYNSTNSTYGKFIPEQEIENGSAALFEGDLHMILNEKAVSFKIDAVEPLIYNDWQLSKDGKTLLLEYHLEGLESGGIQIEYANILKLTDTELKIRLFNNRFYTGDATPNQYILNLIQEFKRVK